MNLLGRLAILFVVVPILELMLLIQIGQVVGLLPTLMLVLFTGVTGAWLARAEGIRVLFQFQREVASGKLPGQALLDGISVLIGGAFLLTPGILTDLTGFSLLFPPTRRWIQRRMRARLEKDIQDGSIRVVTMGSFGAGGFGFGGFGGGGASSEPDFGGGRPDGLDGASGRGPEGRGGEPLDDPRARRPLDPSKGIVIEPKE